MVTQLIRKAARWVLRAELGRLEANLAYRDQVLDARLAQIHELSAEAAQGRTLRHKLDALVDRSKSILAREDLVAHHGDARVILAMHYSLTPQDTRGFGIVCPFLRFGVTPMLNTSARLPAVPKAMQWPELKTV